MKYLPNIAERSAKWLEVTPSQDRLVGFDGTFRFTPQIDGARELFVPGAGRRVA
jgi:hypothetical protein